MWFLGSILKKSRTLSKVMLGSRFDSTSNIIPRGFYLGTLPNMVSWGNVFT